ncbi:hypothetical protein, partial [Scytonema sp. NUACC26]|uniref:hypothetical protein n=1 Tax=Scytonema sp. NUACC26 TaxID=3140176 RepID=UPI0038B2AA20
FLCSFILNWYQYILPESPLMFYSLSLLVEVYKEVSEQPIFTPSEVLINGYYLNRDPLKSGEWQIVGHQQIEPCQVEFPETLIRNDSFWSLQRGELRIAVEVDWGEERPSWNILPTLLSPYALPNFCLYHLDCQHLLKPVEPLGVDYWNLKRIDLRYSNIRSEIYALMEEDENLSYYDISTKWGGDIVRFYRLERQYSNHDFGLG